MYVLAQPSHKLINLSIIILGGKSFQYYQEDSDPPGVVRSGDGEGTQFIDLLHCPLHCPIHCPIHCLLHCPFMSFQWKYALVHQVTQAKYLDEDEQLFLQNFTINKEKGWTKC